jgi:hypothetical protein
METDEMNDLTHFTKARERFQFDPSVIILFVFLTLAFFAPVAFTSAYQLPIGADFVNFNYPNDLFAARSLLAGEIPFWNPYVATGQPYAADPNIGFLYPLRLLFTLNHFDYERMVYLLMIHYSLAGLFTYAVARDLGASKPGSMIAGIGFMFSGFLIGQMDHINIVISSSWSPLIFLLFRRAILRHNANYALLAGLVLSLSVLGGHQQFSLFSGYWCGFWLLIHLIQERGQGLLRSVGLFGTMAVVALAASAVQILPTLEFFQFTQRSALDIHDATAYHMLPITWILLLLPHYFGYHDWQAGFILNSYPNEFYVYAGVIILFMALLGSYTWQSREKSFFLLIILAAFFLTAGNTTPIYQLAYELVPGMKYVRVPGRFIIWINLSLPILAAFGADWIIRQMSKADKRLSRDAITLAIVGSVGGFVFWVVYSLIEPGQVYPEITRYRLTNALTLSTVFVGLAALLWLQRYRPVKQTWITIGLIGLVVTDLFIAQWPRHFTTHNILGVFERHAIERLLRGNADLYRVSYTDKAYKAESWAPLSGLVYGHYQSRGLPWNPFDLQRFDDYKSVVDLEGPFYNLLGVRYLIAVHEEAVPEQWELRLISNGLHVYENSQLMPRAFMAYQSFVESDPERALEIIEQNLFDPLVTVMLDSGEAFSGLTGTYNVEISEMSNNKMVLEVESDQPGYLVISDAFYPGWRATVNETEVELQRANHAFRALFIPDGRSTVRLTYVPVLFLWGAASTMLTWLAVFAVVWRGRHDFIGDAVKDRFKQNVP